MTYCIIVILTLLMLPLGLANGDTKDPAESFSKEPTLKHFKELETPTYEQFDSMSTADKREYLKNDASFDDPATQSIADTYFSENTGEIAANKETFERYYGQKTGTSLSLKGSIEKYKPPSLTPAGGKEFSNFHAIPSGSSITVNPDGSITIQEAGKKDSMRMRGRVTYDENAGDYRIEDGMVNGKTIEGGVITGVKDGMVQGSAKAFGGVSFEQRTAFTYGKESNLLSLDDASISSIDEDTDLNVRGSATVDDFEGLAGELQVGTGNSFSVNGVAVDNTRSGQGAIELNSRGYYTSGDRGENVKEIQQFLIDEGHLPPTYKNSEGREVSSADGIYGPSTKEAVSEWQVAQGLTDDGLFGEKALGAFREETQPEQKDVTLRFQDDSMLEKGWSAVSSVFSGDEGMDNEVLITPDEVDVQGSSYTTTIPSTYFEGMTNPGKAAPPDPIELPERGYMALEDEGEEVQQVQQMLIDEGYLSPTYTKSDGEEVSSADGIYGPATRKAVSEWQKAEGLTDDGYFGPESRDAYHGYNPEASVSVTPLEGRATFSVDEGSMGLSIDGSVNIDSQGSNEIRVGESSYMTEGGSLLQAIQSETGEVFDLPVEITLRDKEGNPVSTLTKKGDLEVYEDKDGLLSSISETATDAKTGLQLMAGYNLDEMQEKIETIEEKRANGVKLTPEEENFEEALYNNMERGGRVAMGRWSSNLLHHYREEDGGKVELPSYLYTGTKAVRYCQDHMNEKLLERARKGDYGSLESTKEGVVPDTGEYDFEWGEVNDGKFVPALSGDRTNRDLYYSVHRGHLDATSEPTDDGKVRITYRAEDTYDFEDTDKVTKIKTGETFAEAMMSKVKGLFGADAEPAGDDSTLEVPHRLSKEVGEEFKTVSEWTVICDPETGECKREGRPELELGAL